MKLFIATFTIGAAAIVGLAYYDMSETTPRYESGRTWQGDSAIFEYADGRLSADISGEIVGRFYSGNPRLVAFDCEGSDSPLIAMEESDLPQCGRVEVISNYQPAAQWAGN